MASLSVDSVAGSPGEDALDGTNWEHSRAMRSDIGEIWLACKSHPSAHCAMRANTRHGTAFT